MERTFGQIEELLRGALRSRHAIGDDGLIWVRDLTADWVAYGLEGTSADGTFKVTYSIDDAGGVVTLGQPEKVQARTEYDVVESQHREPGRVLEAAGTDAAGGRVFHVRIIESGDSLNGRRYPMPVLRASAGLYEGAKAFDHHRTPLELETSTLDGLVGHYRDVQADTTGLVGDLHLLPSATHVGEALDASLEAQAAGLPPVVGISHDVTANWQVARAGQRRVQEATKIVRVLSADVVADPAAGGKAIRMVAGGVGANESSTEKENTMPMSLAELLASATAEDKAAIRALLGDAPATSDDTTTKPVVDDAAKPDSVANDTDGELVGAVAARESLTARSWIRESIADAKLDAKHYETVLGLLPEQVNESVVTQAVGTLQRVAEGLEKNGLVPAAVGGARVTSDALEKARERVYQTLCRNWQEGYSSYYEMFEDITGERVAVGQDGAARIVRESWSVARMPGRASESVDTSSWAEVLGDSIARRMLDMYKVPAYQSWRRVVRTTPVRDFREQKRVRLGGYGDLPAVAQGGTYQPLTSPTDEQATYTVSKRGGTEDLTWESIVNDDLGAVARIPEELGRAAARTLYKFVWVTNFSANPTCTYDSVALFAAGHSNTTAVALANAGMNTLRRLMRDQAGYGVSGEPLGILPRFLVVPNELEDLGNQLTSGERAVPSTTPGATDVPNLHRGTELIVVDHFTDADDWYMVADPMDVPTIEIGFLNGREDPELFMQDDPKVGVPFSSDKVSWKIRHVYSGAVLDHRGFQRGTQ